jgi:hypothetical protein
MLISISPTKKVIQPDGDSFKEDSYISINFTIDHRFLDGAVGAKMSTDVIIFLIFRLRIFSMNQKIL